MSLQAPAPASANDSRASQQASPRPDVTGGSDKRAHFGLLEFIPLATKLIACMLVLLIIGTLGISLAIRQMAGTYLQQKTDSQLIRQAKLGISNATLLSQENLSRSGLGPTDYFLQIRNTDLQIISDDLNQMQTNGVYSKPKLPPDGQLGDIKMGEPFTTPAVVRTQGQSDVDRESLNRARSPWRVVAMRWNLRGEEPAMAGGVLFIGLSMSDQNDTLRALTQYCWIVGILIVLLGAVVAALLIQSTLIPLKRIEKTAAKIAAGDLSQRISTAPENTEVGSLAASLNSMLARIEHSFREQEQTTNKMKQFVSDASHELRTPLAAIHGYAELYRMQRNYPGALERADQSIAHIEASSSRMTDLVQDLLSLARMDEGRGIDVNLEVNVTSVVRDSLDDLHALDPERRVTCGQVVPAPGSGRFAFVEGPWRQIVMRGDPTRLRQVVTNIVGNVHRYTPADSPLQIALSTVRAQIHPDQLSQLPSQEAYLSQFVAAVQAAQAQHRGADYVVMEFIDHGHGTSSEARGHLFERFYTADPSRAREKGGTGLGLAIVESIVKAHQGFICASETPGSGLTFTVVLPYLAPTPTKREARPSPRA